MGQVILLPEPTTEQLLKNIQRANEMFYRSDCAETQKLRRDNSRKRRQRVNNASCGGCSVSRGSARETNRPSGPVFL